MQYSCKKDRGPVLLGFLLPGLIALGCRVPTAQPSRPLAPEGRPGGDRDKQKERKERRDFFKVRFGNERGPGFSPDHSAAVLERLRVEGRSPLAGAGRTAKTEGASALPGDASMVWQHIGPWGLRQYTFGDKERVARPGAGRLLQVWTNRVDPKVLYVAGDGGTFFRCLNADLGATSAWTWERVGDGLVTDSERVWVNEYDPSVLFYGQGSQLYVSRDHGRSWTPTASFPGPVGKVVAADASTFHLAAGAGRLWRSTDSGFSWQAASSPALATQLQDLHRLENGRLIAVGRNTQGYQDLWSTGDEGATWTAATFSGVYADPTRRYSKQDNPNYTPTLRIFGAGNTAYLRSTPDFYVSEDGGLTWSARNPGAATGILSDYNYPQFAKAADPRNPNLLFGSYVNLLRTTDGGSSWHTYSTWTGSDTASAIHADQQWGGAFSLAGTPAYYSVNDGGLAVITNFTADPLTMKQNELAWIDSKMNKGFGTALIYRVGSTGADRDAWVLALQDQATQTHTGDWRGTGDGMDNLIHPTNPLRILAAGTGNPFYSVDGLASSQGCGGLKTNGGWSNRLYLGAEPDTAYYTLSEGQTTALYRTTDFGVNFTRLRIPAGTLQGFAAAKSRGTHLALFVANTGYKSTNTGSSWQAMGPLPGAATTATNWQVVFDPANENTLIAWSRGDFYHPDTARRLFRSTDGGATWTWLQGAATWPAPAAPSEVRIHPTVRDWYLVATTTPGLILESRDAGVTWRALGTGAPVVPIDDLYLPPDGTWLRMATWGHGLWDLELILQPMSLAPLPATTTVTAGQTVSFTAQATGGVRPYHYQWFRDGAPLDGATAKSYTFTATLAEDGARYHVRVTDSAATPTILASPQALLAVRPETGTWLSGNPLTLIKVDSQETSAEDCRGLYAIDGNPATMWHTAYSKGTARYPHEIQVDLGADRTVTDLGFLPRQDGGTNGQIKGYQVYVSSSTANWGAVKASGDLGPGSAEQVVAIPPSPGRYLRVVATSELNGNPWASLAELRVKVQ